MNFCGKAVRVQTYYVSICQSWQQCRPWWIIWFQLRGVSRYVTGRKLTALPYNLINILVPVSINSLLYSGILLKQNLIMMTAGEIDNFVFYSVHKCLFKQIVLFLSKTIYLKRINKGFLGCPPVSWGNKTDPQCRINVDAMTLHRR